MNEWTDQRAGMMAVWVIGGIGLFLLLILATILTYAISQGYAIHF